MCRVSAKSSPTMSGSLHVNEVARFEKVLQDTQTSDCETKQPALCSNESGPVFEPYDILCGRHKLAFNNIGNRRFRVTVSLFLDRYVAATTRVAKTQIVVEILELLYNIKARFLKHDLRTDTWIDLTNKEARAKVGHAIRDMLAAKDQLLPQQPAFLFLTDESSVSSQTSKQVPDPISVSRVRTHQSNTKRKRLSLVSQSTSSSSAQTANERLRADDNDPAREESWTSRTFPLKGSNEAFEHDALMEEATAPLPLSSQESGFSMDLSLLEQCLGDATYEDDRSIGGMGHLLEGDSFLVSNLEHADTGLSGPQNQISLNRNSPTGDSDCTPVVVVEV
jgi:hypothetical protein